MSLRWAFITRMAFMAINNFIWLISWLIFFSHYPSVNGWSSRYFFIMYGTLAIAIGFAGIFGEGAMRLTRMIDLGELDTLLLQPKPILISILGSRFKANGIGDIATGLFIYAWFGQFRPENILPCLIIICSTTLFMLSFFILSQVIGFWVRNMSDWSFQVFDSFLILGTNPNSAFTGVMKILTLTLIPCAFISFFPVEYLIDHHWESLAVSLLGTCGFGGLSVFLFHLGLHRYESGNRFEVRF